MGLYAHLLILVFVAFASGRCNAANVETEDELIEEIKEVLLDEVTETLMQRAHEAGKRHLQSHKQSFKRGINKHSNKPYAARKYMRRFQEHNERTEEIGDQAIKLEAAVRYLEDETKMSRDELSKDQKFLSAWKKQFCHSDTIDCSGVSTVYRTIDGTCNNLQNPRWGSANTRQERFLDADYTGDGLGRSEVDGVPLPNPRFISNTVFSGGSDIRDTHLSIFFMAFGQFLDHDITLTPVIQDGELDCCSDELKDSSDCMAIDIPAGDPSFINTTCMNFVRSVPLKDECVLNGPREQINQITAYIDASMVYGSSTETMNKIRADEDGLLKTNEHDLLPTDLDGKCIIKDVNNPDDVCRECGDSRCTVVPHLTLLHTVFLREHNRIAAILKQQNNNLEQEDIFQITRKIVGAIIQHITYNEWLPEVIGQNKVKEHGLDFRASFTYDPTLRTGISNGFSTAALRYGHSLAPDIQGFKVNYEDSSLHTENIEDTYNTPSYVNSDDGTKLQELARWSVKDAGMLSDGVLNDGVRNKLFNAFDLGALNIQRGRDHGLPSYVKFRVMAGLDETELTTWRELQTTRNHTRDDLDKLKDAYGSNDEDLALVDLFAGGMTERWARQADVGPTFQYILADQFKRLKFGDRFFYTNPGVFTTAQLREIKKVTMARLLCDNLKLDKVAPNVMMKIGAVAGNGKDKNKKDKKKTKSKSNNLTDCKNFDDIPQMEWDAWK